LKFPDREWLLIGLGMLIIAVAVAIVAMCSVGALPAPDDPPQPERQDLATGRSSDGRRYE
jgi:hypothetical protein